ncbi:hypothetical protein BDK51DRAFT_51028 [Blyttiomyces helicus]|uniref:Uncharacterized protein n=1 Tax=Blyttiomyces helicus TaxID=388810 RepID=A0A4V1ISC4_9FUNG|nr:hypothetical protein BDK51DRAFT_51028 [Blyttiomyces helicus]|eukprot:RKO93067.1 hypothetical protein BDK51DRAFT_51028 [Blyttiomyces helicus]
MYSRAPRKFLTPDADHANPKLGPGCYTADESVLVAGKTTGNDGYAPFSSLTARVSYFDMAINPGPPPGAYSTLATPPSTHNPYRAPMFGKSRTRRFSAPATAVPGPGTYRVPSTLKIASKSETTPALSVVPGAKPHALGMEPADTEGGESVQERVEAEQTPKDRPDVGGVAGRAAPGQVPVVPPTVAGSKTRPPIVWKRKYGPPSIPFGKMAFGYQEDEDGELRPRKPPKRTQDECSGRS